MKNYLVIDVETTIGNDGDPFDPRNKLCLVGMATPTRNYVFDIEYSADPYGPALTEIHALIKQAEVLVGFNLKFDLHWIRRYIRDLDLSNHATWDCQLVEFLLSSQRIRFPALGEVCGFYDLGSKLDAVAADYWDHGIDTPAVPRELLESYLATDVSLTTKLYRKQLELLEKKSKQFNSLVWLHNEDTKVLQEMEFNGIKVNVEKLNEKKIVVMEEMAAIHSELRGLSKVPDEIPVNFGSTYHLSSIIYGGYINYDSQREKHTTLKDGTVKTRMVNCTRVHSCPGFASPVKGTEHARTRKLEAAELRGLQETAINDLLPVPYRVYSVDDASLKQIRPRTKGGTRFVELLTKRSNLDQQLTTYLNKIPEMIRERQWKDDIIHGQFNQCVARTGRLSSSKPNLQNLDSLLHDVFITRYVN